MPIAMLFPLLVIYFNRISVTICTVLLLFARSYMLFRHTKPSYTSENGTFPTKMYHVERRLDIYCPLAAMLPTYNWISLSYYFRCLCLTASLAPVHSYTINYSYNVLYLTLKFVQWIRNHPAYAISTFNFKKKAN